MKIKIYTKEKIYNFKSYYDENYNYIFKHAHREDGPAIISYFDNGKIKYKEWYKNGKLYRETGPSVIEYYDNGNVYYEEWWINKKLHREKGPAFISYFKNSNIKYKEYYLNGKKYDINLFRHKLLKNKLQLF